MGVMTVDLQHKIYSLLKTYALPQLRYDNDLMNVLSSVWDVYQRKATGEDYRYKMLGDEIEKHYVMNDDWADDKLFVGILSIFDDDTEEQYLFCDISKRKECPKQHSKLNKVNYQQGFLRLSSKLLMI